MNLNGNNGLDDKIKGFLQKFSKREYSEAEILEAEKKADSKYKDKLGEIWNNARLLFEIAKHPVLWGAQYAVLATLAVIYLVSPVDAVPDFIPLGGLADDIAVIGFIIASVIKGIKSFTAEKKLELRASIPSDLRPLYDNLMGITADELEEEVSFDDLEDSKAFDNRLSPSAKERILKRADKYGRCFKEHDIRRIDDNLDSKRKGPIAAIWDKVLFLWKYFRENHSASYNVMIAGALLYLLSPVDVIPDMIPVIGLVDDAFAISVVYNAIKDAARPAARKIVKSIASKIDPVIEWEVQQFLDRVHYRRLSLSLFNLILYVFALLFIVFPPFGLLPSCVVSAVLLLLSTGFAIFRFVKILTNKHTIPCMRMVIKEKSVKRGLSEYIRSLGIKPVIIGEKAIDRFLSAVGEPANKRFLDRFIDHAWKLLKRDIIRFLAVEACIVAGFFIVRHVLLMQVSDLSFLQIVFYPFVVIYRAFI